MLIKVKSLPADGYLLVTFASSLEQIRPKHALGVIWIQIVCNSDGVSEIWTSFYFENIYNEKKTTTKTTTKTVDVYRLTKNPSVQENSNARTLPVP